MFMRLAFATAVHTECDIFLIDEVLPVGDQPFRSKCMKRITELKAEGRTMVYVSHNPKQVIKLCNRGLVLQAGRDGLRRARARARSRPSATSSTTTTTTTSTSSRSRRALVEERRHQEQHPERDERRHAGQ